MSSLKIIIQLVIFSWFILNGGGEGKFCYIPLEAQEKVFNLLGLEGYVKLPKPGTNPRGVEITKEALTTLTEDNLSRAIMIKWQKNEMSYDAYVRWLDYWREEG